MALLLSSTVDEASALSMADASFGCTDDSKYDAEWSNDTYTSVIVLR